MIETLEAYEPSTRKQVAIKPEPMSTKRMLPEAPFPRKYILSVFVDSQDAMQAAQALCTAGFNERDIYLLEGLNLVEAIAQSQSPLDFLTSTDYDVYLREANRGRSFLAVRPINYAQMERIRNLLAPHHAHLVKYIDTWTVANLIP